MLKIKLHNYNNNQIIELSLNNIKPKFCHKTERYAKNTTQWEIWKVQEQTAIS